MASFQLASKYHKGIQILFVGLLSVLLDGCSALDPQQANTQPVTHEAFDALLKKYVAPSGLVSYIGFQEDRAKLQDYLEYLTSNPPNDDNWNESEKLAYWINLYNAFTIELVLQYYPIASIKDIGASVQVPFVNTPWDIKFIEIGKEKYDLNNVEHNIIRQIFDEPRIHFAVNCASISCPKLRREAYTGARLDSQLQEQAIDFLNDPERNEIGPEKAEISKIFRWYGGDFTKKSSLREFLNQYAQQKMIEGADIGYKDYDWSLNELRN